jgi:hypothetical protein
MTWWPGFAFYFGIILLNTIAPFLLCRCTLLAFSKIGGPQSGMWKSMLVSIIGFVGFFLVLRVGLTILWETNANLNPCSLIVILGFLVVYFVVIIIPVKVITKFNYFKASLLVVAFWILQFSIQFIINKIIFRPLINVIK